MAAEHGSNPSENTDEVVLRGIRATITEDDDGVVLVRVSGTPQTHLVVWWNHDVVLDLAPDEEQRASMREARRAERGSSPFEEQLREAVRRRIGESTVDPSQIMLEEAVKLHDQQGSAHGPGSPA